jgi:hypothetical protein
MSLTGFDDIVRLEQELGPDRLADIILKPEPGWIDARSWEFWRGRLVLATGRDIPAQAPVRSFVCCQISLIPVSIFCRRSRL